MTRAPSATSRVAGRMIVRRMVVGVGRAMSMLNCRASTHRSWVVVSVKVELVICEPQTDLLFTQPDSLNTSMRFALHTFRPTETIDAVIRLLGRHSYTKGEMRHLRAAFDRLNGFVVPRPGMTYKIPMPFEVTDDFGNLVDVTPPEPEEDTASATPDDV